MMKQIKSLIPAIALASMLALPALAQTPRDIQALIAGGQENQALQDLQTILHDHPQSGMAWYLTAEAQDALGNEPAARNALAKADQYAPGLPFANANDAASLRAHLSAAPAATGAMSTITQHGGGFSPVLVIAGLVLLFLVLRAFRRRRAYPVTYPGAQNPGPYYGQGGGMPYGPGPGMGGGGLGSSILGGLAAGAGFAAGERVIDNLMGGGQRSPQEPSGNDFNNPIPDRDDGLQGNPGWDDNSGGGGQDDSNSW